MYKTVGKATISHRSIAIRIQPWTRKELDCVEKHADSDQFNVLRLLESDATPERVLKSMERSCWVHFACHGEQNTSGPIDSALLLAGRSKLTLSEIVKLSLQNADLAFLSACQTSSGNEDLP